MTGRFRDRTHAGRLLAKQLVEYANRSDVIVLGLPRGGVPVAFEVARELNASLDVFVVRKLGVPGHRELAMGAIASGGVRVLNDVVVYGLDIPQATIDAVAATEELELKRRELVYRGHAGSPEVNGKVVIVVDDGIATGSTMRAALRALRHQKPARIVMAVPTCARSSHIELKSDADEAVVLMIPEDFIAVGQWYEDFSQTTDEEVTALLEQARHKTAVP